MLRTVLKVRPTAYARPTHFLIQSLLQELGYKWTGSFELPLALMGAFTQASNQIDRNEHDNKLV